MGVRENPVLVCGHATAIAGWPHGGRLRRCDRVLQAGLYGGEPRDVFDYATANAAFPHESTADQFFSESQFESYRALGRHIVATLNADWVKTGYKLTDVLGAPWRQRFLGNFG